MHPQEEKERTRRKIKRHKVQLNCEKKTFSVAKGGDAGSHDLEGGIGTELSFSLSLFVSEPPPGAPSSRWGTP